MPDGTVLMRAETKAAIRLTARSRKKGSRLKPA
jgi:hypothetical protein